MYSGVACGKVLNEELYAQRFQKLIYLRFSIIKKRTQEND